ncbi:MAG: diguanylate cyclase [Nitrospirae bacterium]|nr:diguanylate cyclase [Nitrospirota bacterium]
MRYVFALMAIWTVIIYFSLGMNVLKVRQDTLNMARIHVMDAYKKDLLYRRWAAMHGGVYVPVTDKTPPNPYLSDIPDRDISMPSGKLLTLMNPAYMTRQVYELAKEAGEIVGHVTSLKPIRPENKPDEWEAEALKAFEAGKAEVSSVETMDGKEYMRLMLPFITETSCLKCHAKQGYKAGDIRGGISISVPMEHLWASASTLISRLAFFHVFIWVMGIAGIFFGAARLGRSEERYRNLFENANDMIQSVAPDGRFMLVNDSWLKTMGYERWELDNITIFDVIHPDSKAHCNEVFRRIMSGEAIDNMEAVFVSKDGRRIEVEGNVRCRFENSRPLATHAMFRDVTRRKEAERELSRRQADLSVLYKVSTAISQTIDIDKLFDIIMTTITGLEVLNLEKKGGVFIVKGEDMELVSHLGHPDIFLEMHKEMKVGVCLCGHAAKTGEIIISKNSGCDAMHTIRYSGMAHHGHIILPLKAKDKVAGVLYLYLPPDFVMEESRLELLVSIGNQIGIAIENAKLYEETKASALHDPLTGLANRRQMYLVFEKNIALAKRTGRPLSLIMLDIDYFKKYNDAHGHSAGDDLLVRLAGLINKEIREADLAVRYGGEEFLILLYDADLKEAFEIAERMRRAVENNTEVTISLGVALYLEGMKEDEFVNEADNALYQAKKKGRNRVEL